MFYGTNIFVKNVNSISSVSLNFTSEIMLTPVALLYNVHTINFVAEEEVRGDSFDSFCACFSIILHYCQDQLA